MNTMFTMNTPDAAEDLIRGAGPYGVSAYAHLRSIGIRAPILG